MGVDEVMASDIIEGCVFIIARLGVYMVADEESITDTDRVITHLHRGVQRGDIEMIDRVTAGDDGDGGVIVEILLVLRDKMSDVPSVPIERVVRTKRLMFLQDERRTDKQPRLVDRVTAVHRQETVAQEIKPRLRIHEYAVRTAASSRP